MTDFEDRLTALIAPVVADAGFDLVRLRLTGSHRKTVQVMAERPDKTMSAGDCATLSRRLSAVLDEADPFRDPWTLEVSSPGIDRPLVRLSDYHDWQGYSAKIELNRPIEGRKRFTGVLGGVEDGAVVLDIDGETEAALIPFDWIAHGKLVLTEELIRESLAAGKAALAARGETAEDETDEDDFDEVIVEADNDDEDDADREDGA